MNDYCLKYNNELELNNLENKIINVENMFLEISKQLYSNIDVNVSEYWNLNRKCVTEVCNSIFEIYESWTISLQKKNNLTKFNYLNVFEFVELLSYYTYVIQRIIKFFTLTTFINLNICTNSDYNFLKYLDLNCLTESIDKVNKIVNSIKQH